MMFLGTLSLIVTLGLIIFFITIVRKTTITATIMNTKIIVLLFTGYIIILLVGTTLFFILPTNGSNYEKVDLYQADELDPYTDQDYYTAIDEGRFHDARGLTLSDKWEFEYDKDTLHIRTKNHDYMNMRVMVERKGAEDNKVEVNYYASRTVFGGFDISDEVEKHHIEFKDNAINITLPKPYELKLASFNHEFPITQFTDERLSNSHHYSYVTRGENILHLRIPSNLEVTGEGSFYLQYIGE